MMYKYELVSNGLVVRQGYLKQLTNPNQVARKVVENHKGLDISRYIINVVNENGDYWIYSVRKESGSHKVRRLACADVNLTSDEIDLIFSGNTTLRSIMNG